MDQSLVRTLAADLANAGLTDDGLRVRLGAPAADALDRGDGTPARRALRGATDPLALLARLFVLGDAVPLGTAASSLGRPTIDAAVGLRVLRVEGERAVPLVAIRPHAFAPGEAGWIASDLDELAGVFPLRPDHVLGVGGAGRTLAALLPPEGTGRALDLGCGCGIIALHLRRRGFDVVATDISERALWFTRLNAALNGLDGIEVRLGSLYEPVAGERFALIASNPPFVITPRTDAVPHYEYRDGGARGDDLMAQVVTGARAHLEPDGSVRLLGNWEDAPDADGLDRVRTWTTGLGAWVIEREHLDPVRYAQLWVRDGGTRPGTPEYETLLDAWLDDFAARDVNGVGMGWVILQNAPGLDRFERIGRQVDPTGLGAHVAGALTVAGALSEIDDAALAASVLQVTGDVTEARHHVPGSDAPSVIELRQGGAFGRTVDADPSLAALVGACDGELPVGVLIDAIAQLLEVDAADLRADLLPQVRELLFTGFLVAAG
ncbi:methyltransferase [Microbacterium sp. cx-59]|uniref:methyltransferase n=1 Tax=Microbacterium sp. cx-59 TaxID=2891207 RepID=UPI001E480FF0|nr:methyltransferase [Microbacterium sp. cx-59]MCC4908708.1 class I SAM-dependent methyltransferase [Microbacterium sp. cx-59]